MVNNSIHHQPLYPLTVSLLLSFCRGHHLSIAGSCYQRKDIHRFSWIYNDGHTRKETDHILSSCGKMVRQCRVYRSFDVDSDHFPVLATLKLKLKRSTQPQTKHCHLFLILTWVGSMRRMFPQNLKPPPWRIRPLKPCGVITKLLSILLQKRFLENVCVPRNHGYPRLLLLLLISAGKLSEGEM